MEERIHEIIKQELNAKVLEVKRINEGYSHYMYDVKMDTTPYEMIIRFSNNKRKDVNLGKEEFVINLLKENDIPVPKIYAIKKEGCEGYILLEKVKGERLDIIWGSLSDENKKQVTEKIGELLARIHKIELKEFGMIEEGGEIRSDEAFKFRKVGEELLFSPFLRQRLMDFFEDVSRLLSYKTISPEFFSKFILYLTKNLEKIEYKGKPVLNHGDFIPGHIFVEKKGNEYEIVGLIDFEFALAYAPEYDFLKLHRAGFFENPELKKALEEGYGREVDGNAVEIHRLMRDLGFAWAVLEAGNKELSDKTLKDIEGKINKKFNEGI